MYCRNCGKEYTVSSDYCLNCGARPLTGNSYCQACASPTTPLSEICVKCGTRLIQQSVSSQKRAKSKTASILLAVFLTFWTWLYTYKRDGWKFWVGLGLCTAITGLNFFYWIVAIINTRGRMDLSEEGVAFLGILYVFAAVVWTGIWIWGIVDTAVKNNNWYDNYS